MDKLEFAQKVASIQVIKSTSVNGGPALTIVAPDDCKNLSAANSPDSVYREKANRWIRPFNILVKSMARRLGYVGDLQEFYAKTAYDVNQHVYIKVKDGVYIRTNRGYNNNGPRKNGPATKRKENTQTMKNRKVTLTLFTLISGAPLTLQVTGGAKDATGWTRFLDVDLGKLEYEKSNWTKDVASENKAAVDAIDAMIQIEEDYAAGKLEKDAAVDQFKTKYVEWVIAHRQTNPDFVDRRIPGLNVENPMSIYDESDEAAE